MQPALSGNAKGWLRFIWEKATTADDWSSDGVPHPWWDRTSTAPMCAFPRFDLGETAYILPVLADQTPAWREVYTRIADELVGRHTTFWAASDWLSLIGPDPHNPDYPPEWQAFVPPHLQGRYELPGWTANGIEPWGLQPDPIGADGNLFFRGFFNLLLSIYRYVSGDEKWERPFEVTGYRDVRYRWSHYEIAEFLNQQWRERPQGPHCENTKIWPYCLSAAGLGLQMYDQTTESRFHGVFDEWVEYAKKHYLIKDRRGRLKAFPFYYDPIQQSLFTFPGSATAYAALAITPYLLPQNPTLGEFLYREATRMLGWSQPSNPLLSVPDPRFRIIGLLAARELGDDVTAGRLRDSLEDLTEPRRFGAEDACFGYWFDTGEDHPRGQLSALMMLCETGQPGSWTRAFNNPTCRQRFAEPTVEGVDFPRVGIDRARNDPDTRALGLSIYPAIPSARGQASTLRVTGLPHADAATVLLNDERYPDWHAVSETAIEIQFVVGDLDFTVFPGGASQSRRSGASDRRPMRREPLQPAPTTGHHYAPTSSCPGACC